MAGFLSGRCARSAALALLFSSLVFLTCERDDGQSGDPTGPWEAGLDRPAPSIRSFDSPMLMRITDGGGYDPSVCSNGIHLAYSKPDAGIAIKDLRRGGTVVLIGPGAESDWCRANPALLLLRRGGELCVYNAVTQSIVWSCVPDIDDGAVWSPLGNEIAAQGDEGIVIVRYLSGARSVVPCSDSYGCEGEEPTWSPDGQWIAFEDGLEIMKVSRHGGTAVEIIGGLNDVTEPAWSPDGRWIAFVMDSAASLHIWIADPTGRNKSIAQVTHGPFCDRNPAWSPDSRMIYFSRQPTADDPGDFASPDVWVTTLPEPATEKQYFPLDVGNTWTFRDERFDRDGNLEMCDTIFMTVLRDTLIGTERWAVVSFGAYLGLGINRADGLRIGEIGGVPELKFKFPATVGDSYPAHGGGWLCTVESINDTVPGPTGPLNCYRYRTGETVYCDYDIEWVAPGLGLVKGDYYGFECGQAPRLAGRSVLIAAKLKTSASVALRGVVSANR
ncbi:MAG: hypothetical protein AB1752_12155 [Candidatus Zixiibacteriota bacterium]